MRILVVSYDPEALSEDAAYLAECGHQVVLAKNFVTGLSAFFKDPTNPDASVDAAVVDIDKENWSGTTWPGLWLLNEVRRKKIQVPFLLHASKTSYEEFGVQKIDFAKLNCISPRVEFHVREQNRQYMSDFLNTI